MKKITKSSNVGKDKEDKVLREKERSDKVREDGDDRRTKETHKVERIPVPPENILPQKPLNKYQQLPPVLQGDKVKDVDVVKEKGIFKKAKKTLDTQQNKLSYLEEFGSGDESGDSKEKMKVRELTAPKKFGGKKKKAARDTMIIEPLKPVLAVELRYEDLFGKFVTNDYYPLHEVKNLFKADPTQYISTVNLDGIDQLTDLFFRCMLHEVESKRFSPLVVSISLQGCVNITDKGIEWMARALGRFLFKVTLCGCRISSQALVHLSHHCQNKLDRLDLNGTNIDFLCLQRHWFGMTKLLAHGCPLVLPNSGYVMDLVKDGTQLPLRTYKAVIITDETLKMSTTEYLAAQTMNTDNLQPVYMFPQWKHPNGSFYNLFECDQDLADLFISERALFILPYSSEQSRSHIIKKMIHILTKVPSTVVLLLRFSKGKLHGSGLREAVNRDLNLVRERLEKQVLEAMSNLDKLTSFEQQEVMRNASALIDAIDQMYVMHCDIDVNEKQLPMEFEKALEEYETKIHEMYPQYEKVIKQFHDLANKVELVSTIGSGMNLATELVKTQLLHGNEETYLRAINLMHIMGKVLYLPDTGSNNLVTDLQWFGKVLNVIITKSQETAKGRLLSVTPQTPIWSPEALTESLRNMVPKEEILNDVKEFLVTSGIVYSRHHLLVSHHLPQTTHLPLSHYWTDPATSPDSSVVYNYNLYHEIPQPVFYKIIQYCVKLRPPAVVWREGILIQEGGVDCLIQSTNQGQGIEVASRTFSPPKSFSADQVDVIHDCLWSTVKQYKLIVDYCLFKVFKLFAKVERATYNMAVSIPGVQIASPELKGTFPNIVPYHHVIQSHAEASCEWCGMLGDNVKMLWTMHQSLRPTLHNQHVSLGHDQRLNILRLNAAESFSSTCMSPYEFSHYDVLLLDSCDGLGIGIRSWHNRGYSVLLECWKVLVYNQPNPPKVHVALTALQKWQKGDRMRVSLREGTQPEVYMLSCLRNGIQLFEMEVPRDDYIPEIIHSKGPTSSVNMAECIVDMALAPKWQSPFPPNIKLKDPNIRQYESDIIGKKVELRGTSDEGQVGIFPATVTRLIPGDDSTTVEVTIDHTSNSKPTAVSLDNVYPVGFTAESPDMDYEYQVPVWEGTSPKFDWREYLLMEHADPLPASFLSYENEESLVLSALKGFTTDTFTQCRKLRNRPIVFETCIRHTLPKLMKQLDQMDPHTPMYSLLPDLTQNDILYPTREVIQKFDNLKYHFLCPVKEGLHFVNKKGVPFRKENDIQQLLSYIGLSTFCDIILLDQKAIIPTEAIDQLVTVEDNIPPDLLDQGFRRILYIAICTFFMLSKDVLKPVRQGQASQMPFSIDTYTRRSYICPGHSAAKMANSSVSTFPSETFKPYANLISDLDYSSNAFTEIPGPIFETFTALTGLNFSENLIEELPGNIGKADKLVNLNLSGNRITSVPESIKDLTSLTYLNLAGNPILKLPKQLYLLVNLRFLDLSNTGLVSLSEDISQLRNLQVLLLAGLSLKTLPENFTHLTKLTNLDVSGIRWLESTNRNSILTRTSFDEFLESNVLLKAISKQERDAMFTSFDKGHKGNLDFDDIQNMNTALFQKFNRFQDDGVTGGFPHQLLTLTKLEHLNLSFQGLTTVPDEVSAFKSLKFLDVSHNPKLQAVSGELGVAPLEGLFLKGCPSLKTPPKEIVSKGFKVTYAYLKRLHMGSVSCKRTKLMLVGLGGAGKTSLVKSLTADVLQKEETGLEKITDGIDITSWKIADNGKDEEVTFSVWDFAGQTVYYNTHQFFLSNRAVYLLLWNVRLGYEHAGLDFWCSSIACHAPKAPILVVGSHVDKVEEPELPEEAMKSRYPQIKGFHYISSATGKGLKELSENLTNITKQEKYMGEMIPEAWLTLEKKILDERSTSSLLPWETVVSFANQAAIYDEEEVSNAVQFLHDLGSLQHFKNDRLKSRVVINPQWIVDVMASVVSVHSTPIKQGLFYKEDMSIVWKDYPEDLHTWLLDLTEEFDLTFPLTDKDANLVPCLLPEAEPKYVWPDITEKVGLREIKVFYKFEYLPVGLFNRGQVRLYQFSDQSVIWRKGSLLRKNNHLALIIQNSDVELQMKVQGPRPENILFLIHEVFESLIAESFHGVQYDYFVPCADCLADGSLDPCMFSAAKIRRAMEFKVPFLQCDKYFHMLTMSELHSMKPPESGSDYDAHLEKTAHDLRNLRETMTKELVMFYCTANSPSEGQNWPDDLPHPRQIRGDLEKAGFKIWFPDNPAKLKMDQFTVTVKHAKLILVCISNEFESDQNCCDVLHFMKEILRKKILVICVGENYAWQKSNLGILTASEVYVNMTKGKPYESKIDELKEAILRKLGNVKKEEQFDVFVSYCWTNSLHAVKQGMKHIPEAVGWGDPREVKDYLENNGLHCWMDIERTGVGGLFEDIAEGLRHARVMVACISDEYVKSKNCLMEFQFAKVTLRIPIVIAVFGTGAKWETSELGMLSLGHDRIDFKHENPTGHQRLLEMVREKLPPGVSQGDVILDDYENQQISYHELFELGQRKFLRQVAMFADSMESGYYPRLAVVDILPIETDDKAEDQVEKEQASAEKPEVFKDTTTEAYRLCYKLLCENEDGWHVVEPYIPCPIMSKPEQEKFLTSVAPYLVRIMALLKHSTLNLNMIQTVEGQALMARLLEKTSPESSDFRDQYMTLRKAVITQDENRVVGNMKRCHLPSRKVIWLCEEHQEVNPVVVLDKDDPGLGLTEMEDDVILVEQLHQHHQLIMKDLDVAHKDAVGETKGKLVESVLAANIGANNTAVSQVCVVS